MRKAELSQIDKVEVADPLTVRLLLKAPFSPLIAQLTDRAGMMVSPEGREGGRRQVRQQADLRRAVTSSPNASCRNASCSTASPDYWDKDRIHIDRVTYLPIPDSTVRLANLRAGALDLIERHAPDRHPGGARRPQAEAA